MDEVLLTFGSLFMQYQAMGEDKDVQNAILSSLERRWAKADQEVFIAAVLVNPLFRVSPFRRLDSLNRSGIRGLFTRLWRRFYPSEPPSFEFSSHIFNFIDGNGFFAELDESVNYELQCAAVEVCQWPVWAYSVAYIQV
jgi:hypothetical protein